MWENLLNDGGRRRSVDQFGSCITAGTFLKVVVTLLAVGQSVLRLIPFIIAICF